MNYEPLSKVSVSNHKQKKESLRQLKTPCIDCSVFNITLLIQIITVFILLFSLYSQKQNYKKVFEHNTYLKDTISNTKNRLTSLYSELSSLDTRRNVYQSKLVSSEREFSKKKEELSKLKVMMIKYLEKIDKLYPGSKPYSKNISPSELNMLERWSNTLIASLCYRYSEDGPEPATFHKKCDSKKGTLTVITTKEGQVFGGYTSVSWDGDTQKRDDCAFLFSVTQNKKFPIKDARIAINTKKILLPTFGMDDIYISAEVSSLRNRMASYEDRKSFEINNGKMLFDVKDIEVFHVIDTYTWKE